MNTILKFTFTVCLLIMAHQAIFSQETFPGMKNRQVSFKEDNLMSQMQDAKISGERNKMPGIQMELDNETGSVTKSAENYPGTFVLVNEPVNTLDNINIVGLSQLHGIQALATVTEQRGQNTGRIWVIAAVSNSTARDTIYYFRTDDGGISWTLAAYLSLGNSDQVNYDQMDAEMIEDITGDKYLWVFYGLTAVNGKKFVGGAVLKTPTFLANEFALAWPGENFSNLNFERFRPRITSDNARYSNSASIFLTLSMDTISGANHKGGFNFLKCNNPYTTSPLFTYIPSSISTLTSNNPTDLQIDIAYINDSGGDSLMFVISNMYYDPGNLGIAKIGTNFVFGLTFPPLLPNLTTYNKDYGRIACSGGLNQTSVMIIYRDNYQNSGDWDLKGFRTNNGGTTWGDVNLDVRRDNVITPYPPDISSVRNRDGRFNIAYTVAGPGNYDTVKYLFSNSGQTGFFVRTVNHLSGFQRPKPGVRLINGDSCLTVWSQPGNGSGNNIWVSEGCSGQITSGIENTGSEIPSAYNLSQNYPNPFNPVTNIKFSIPKSGYVKLIIYDITGKVVETLIDENMAAGTYKTDFDASQLASGVYLYRITAADFTDVKKMVLVK